MIKRHLAACVLIVLMLLLAGCEGQYRDTVICDAEPFNQFGTAVSLLLPDYTVRYANQGALQDLNRGAVIEAYDFLALPALEIGAADHWRPLYSATTVIAVDRDLLQTEIAGWRDLLSVGAVVSVCDRTPEFGLILASISHGLEGDPYEPQPAAELLRALYKEHRLVLNDYDAPILICFDHQAVALCDAGRNLEIIVPNEGTLIFEKGLLSGETLDVSTDSEAILLASGFRLPDGRSTGDAYPAAESYAVAGYAEDYTRLSALCDDATYILKRDVQRISSYLYSTSDGREHQLYALVFITLVILWIGYVLKRTMQRGVRLTTLLIAVFVIGWVLLRLFKYQIPLGTLNQYCWYGYYFFRLALTLVGVWLAWAIDRPVDTVRPPRWWVICAVVNFLLFLLVATNNLHYQAFLFDPSDPAYNVNFTYGPVYYLATGMSFLQILVMQVIFVVKSKRNPRKLGFIFPIAFYALLAVYCVGYVLGTPMIRETDSTIIIGTFAVVFIEACIRSGLIPINSKYKVLFQHSPLKMQIVSTAGGIVLTSAEMPAETITPDDILRYQRPITGGSVIWQEDISSINQLHREISAAGNRLKAVNAMLIEEERIKSRLAATEARTLLFSELENEIRMRTEQLAGMIDTLSKDDAYQPRVAAITLLLCYIKRRCILFFRERETADIPLDEIIVYLDELGEFAAFAGMQFHVSAAMYSKLPTRHGTLFYDFAYSFLERTLTRGYQTMLTQLTCEPAGLTMKILLSESAEELALSDQLMVAIGAAGGSVAVKDMDDAVSVWLSFPVGGEDHA